MIISKGKLKFYFTKFKCILNIIHNWYNKRAQKGENENDFIMTYTVMS